MIIALYYNHVKHYFSDKIYKIDIESSFYSLLNNKKKVLFILFWGWLDKITVKKLDEFMFLVHIMYKHLIVENKDSWEPWGLIFKILADTKNTRWFLPSVFLLVGGDRYPVESVEVGESWPWPYGYHK